MNPIERRTAFIDYLKTASMSEAFVSVYQAQKLDNYFR